MANESAIRAGRAFVELFADDSKLVRGMRAAETKLRAFGNNVAALGKKMFMGGAAVVGGLFGTAKVFADFETQMKMVSTMLDEPEKHMEAFTQGIRKLSVEFGESTGVLAKGLYDLLSASVDPAKALGVLAVATKAAKGGMTDTAIAVDGLTSVLNAFQMSADQAGHVADVMFQTVKRGKLTFPDLAGNIGKVAPMARAAGMSMEDMMAALATMTRQGLNTEEAATRLVNILKAAPAQAANLQALVAKYVGKNLEEIQVDFPEVRAAGGIAALAADMAGFRQDLDLMQNAAGRADEAFVRMTGGLSGALKKARESVNELLSAVGEALAPVIKDFTGWAIGAAASVRDWAKQNGDLLKQILKYGAILTGAGAAMTVFGKAVAGVAAAFKVARLAMVAFSTHPLIAALTAVAAGVLLIVHKFATETPEYDPANDAEFQKAIADRDRARKELEEKGKKRFAEDVATMAGFYRRNPQYRAGLEAKAQTSEFHKAILDTLAREEQQARDVAQTDAAERQRVADLNERLQDELHRLKIEGIEDEYQREWQSIQAIYDAKVREAERAGADIELIEMARNQRLAQLNRRQEQKAADEQKRFQEDLFRTETELQDEIDRLKIETDKGLTPEQKARQQMELRHANELRALRASGLDDTKNMHLLLQKQDLEAKQLAMAQDLPQTLRQSVSGTFNATVVGRMGSGNQLDRIAKATEGSKKNLDELLKRPAAVPAFT